MRYRFFCSVLTGAALGGIVLGAASCTSASDAQATSADTAAVAGGATLRVMTYNIHHANPPGQPDQIDVEGIADVIRRQRPDLVALQEVDVRTARAGQVDEAERLAAALDMHVYFGKAMDYDGGGYGVALLSRFPLSETQVMPLPAQPAPPSEPRVLATARVQLPNGRAIRFASTHLDAGRDSTNRQLQIDAIVQRTAADSLPWLIGGDFNATPHSGVIRTLDAAFTRTCHDCAPTIPIDRPEKAIDFLAFRGEPPFRVVDHQVINHEAASDHLPVVAELTY
ncbi:Metal-dependent hydrolase, endonuclease/exonuclease/phosphatase family [Catalinimonas alkaloidigena]|uniref:Metal-dependent hydrolase, endonuclease/exonuclease/phosphatase family n=1 Tax=Catalinimonas alkaloidigena TaxID=1075417 RepID=A0A1G9SE77_9BACT|nr:endonuclease/exonuclease/phosphatase family protein [Catalinimonas alkaloidigena]SDM33796.1 Metal-dependent hydrolase, endonuclease/exonuclease/phosphatase family [Catalinimonas alkaloidigena]